MYGADFLFSQELGDPNPAVWLVAIWPYMPAIKMAPIFIGYLTLAYSVFHDASMLQLRLQIFEIKRQGKRLDV